MNFNFVTQKTKIRSCNKFFEHFLQEIIGSDLINNTLLNSFDSVGDLFLNKLKLSTLQTNNNCIKKIKQKSFNTKIDMEIFCNNQNNKLILRAFLWDIKNNYKIQIPIIIQSLITNYFANDDLAKDMNIQKICNNLKMSHNQLSFIINTKYSNMSKIQHIKNFKSYQNNVQNIIYILSTFKNLFNKEFNSFISNTNNKIFKLLWNQYKDKNLKQYY